MKAVPPFPTDRVTVIEWPDPVIAEVGHDPRAGYVERYWLGILGPSTTFLLRQIADELEANPQGFVMDFQTAASRIGIRVGSRHSAFIRSLGRFVQFDLAQMQGPSVLAVRRRVPTLSRRYLGRLSQDLRVQHDEWTERQVRRSLDPLVTHD